MSKRKHHVVQHRAGIAGVEAMTMFTEHSFPRHSHDHFGIGVMISGAQRSWSNVGEVESEAGDLIMLNPGEMHDGAPVGGARSWHILYLDPALVAREFADETAGIALIMRPVAQDPELADAITGLFRHFDALVPDSLAIEESLLQCVMRVSRRHGLDGPRDVRSSPSVTRAIEYLDACPEAPVSLADLAELSNVSRFQLLRGFHRDVGVTPHAYLIQLRVRLARRELAAGSSVAEAALSAGFADQSHMTRAFVRQFGVTPGRYKAAIS